MTAKQPELVIRNGCVKCRFFTRLVTETSYGECECPPSDHYAHVISVDHPRCTEFAVR